MDESSYGYGAKHSRLPFGRGINRVYKNINPIINTKIPTVINADKYNNIFKIFSLNFLIFTYLPY